MASSSSSNRQGPNKQQQQLNSSNISPKTNNHHNNQHYRQQQHHQTNHHVTSTKPLNGTIVNSQDGDDDSSNSNEQLPKLYNVHLVKRENAGLGFLIRQRAELPYFAVWEIIRSGAAEECGRIRKGDLLLKVNNQDLAQVNYERGLDILKSIRVGEKVELTLLRPAPQHQQRLSSQQQQPLPPPPNLMSPLLKFKRKFISCASHSAAAATANASGLILVDLSDSSIPYGVDDEAIRKYNNEIASTAAAVASTHSSDATTKEVLLNKQPLDENNNNNMDMVKAFRTPDVNRKLIIGANSEPMTKNEPLNTNNRVVSRHYESKSAAVTVKAYAPTTTSPIGNFKITTFGEKIITNSCPFQPISVTAQQEQHQQQQQHHHHHYQQQHQHNNNNSFESSHLSQQLSMDSECAAAAGTTAVAANNTTASSSSAYSTDTNLVINESLIMSPTKMNTSNSSSNKRLVSQQKIIGADESGAQYHRSGGVFEREDSAQLLMMSNDYDRPLKCITSQENDTIMSPQIRETTCSLNNLNINSMSRAGGGVGAASKLLAATSTAATTPICLKSTLTQTSLNSLTSATASATPITSAVAAVAASKPATTTTTTVTSPLSTTTNTIKIIQDGDDIRICIDDIEIVTNRSSDRKVISLSPQCERRRKQSIVGSGGDSQIPIYATTSNYNHRNHHRHQQQQLHRESVSSGGAVADFDENKIIKIEPFEKSITRPQELPINHLLSNEEIIRHQHQQQQKPQPQTNLYQEQPQKQQQQQQQTQQEFNKEMVNKLSTAAVTSVSSTSSTTAVGQTTTTSSSQQAAAATAKSSAMALLMRNKKQATTTSESSRDDDNVITVEIPSSSNKDIAAAAAAEQASIDKKVITSPPLTGSLVSIKSTSSSSTTTLAAVSTTNVQSSTNNNLEASPSRQHKKSLVKKGIKLKFLLDGSTNMDVLHNKSVNKIGCTPERCMGSVLEVMRPARKEKTKTKEEILAEAVDFINQFYASVNREGSKTHKERVEEVIGSINTTGTYELKETELCFGARTAWRNASRCIGRIQWSKLQVFDARYVTTARGMFEAICNHLKYATNKGNIRSAITVFRQRTAPDHDFRVWNGQLVNYAGYRIDDQTWIGDRANIEVTEICMKLGWKPKYTDFDLLPLVLQANGQDPEWFDLPPDLVMEVPIIHPKYDWFRELKLKWYCVPAVASMLLDVGGLEFSACPFNGWYMGTEIGRDLADVNRFNKLTIIAEKIGLEVKSNSSLWKDKALVELNYAVLYSFQKANVTIIDHHTAAESFMKHYENENKLRGGCPGDWVWITPPMSSHLTPVFHLEMLNYTLKPSYEYQEAAWKTHVWKMKPNTDDKSKRVRKRVYFSDIARAVKFSAKLMGKALARRVKCTILYATETGRSERFAKTLDEIFKHAFDAKVLCMKDYDVVDLEHETLLLVVTSTFGNGDPPENGEELKKILSHMRKDKAD